MPGSTSTVPTGISGNNVIGRYIDNYLGNYFLYNASTSTFTTLNVNGAPVQPTAISGNNIVGWYYNPNIRNASGFLYNASTFTYNTLNAPGSTETVATGVDGNNVVGYYYSGQQQYGFLYMPDVSPVPEPASLTLLGIGIAVLTCYGKRRWIIRGRSTR